MPIELTEVECRVLGVLIEKSLTQAGTYPLTLNAVTLGANQKQNREPVVDYTDQEVAKAVHDLERKRLAKQAPPSAGARANRFEHDVVERLAWDRRQQAIVAELMLRGRQTVGELRTRASRMTPLSDLAVVSGVLVELMEHDPPFARELPREPGRSVTRYEHLLGGSGDSPIPSPEPTEDQAIPSATAAQSQSDGDDLGDRVQRLEARVDELERLVARLNDTQSVVDAPGVDSV